MAETPIRSETTRRSFLALGLGAGLAASPRRAVGRSVARTLFIGNSFTRDHDVPALVVAFAAAAGRYMNAHVIVRPGATLWGHWRRDTVRETLGWGWDAVVLQDHSTEALWEDRRARSSGAVHSMVRAVAPAPVALVVPWSRRADHLLYEAEAQQGYAAPRTPAEMTALNTAHWSGVAREAGTAIAPVATVFADAAARGAEPWADDGYHANPAGARLAAESIWRALST